MRPGQHTDPLERIREMSTELGYRITLFIDPHGIARCLVQGSSCRPAYFAGETYEEAIEEAYKATTKLEHDKRSST